MDPLITIITVVKNDEKNIEKTVLSVLSQDYTALEYIVIDGGSTDGTMSVLQKHSGKISRLISESDQNIYDAMNKGALLAKGAWINFMNSGDCFVDKCTVSEVFSADRGKTDLIYGSSIIRYRNGKTRLLKVNNNISFWKRYINHQSIFTKTQLLREHPFSMKYDLCSDFDFLMAIFLKNKNIQSLDYPVSVRTSGGRSDKNRIRAHIQKAIILKNLKNPVIDQCKVSIWITTKIFLECLKSLAKLMIFRSR